MRGALVMAIRDMHCQRDNETHSRPEPNAEAHGAWVPHFVSRSLLPDEPEGWATVSASVKVATMEAVRVQQRLSDALATLEKLNARLELGSAARKRAEERQAKKSQ